MKLFLKIYLFLLLPLSSFPQVNPLFIEPTKKEADSLKLELEKDINDTLRMTANREIALYYLEINSDSALFFIERDLPLAKKLQQKLWEADAYDLIGIISTDKGNYVKSLKSFNEAMRITEGKECEKNIWNISKFTNSNKPEYARLSMLGTIQSDATSVFRETENYDKELLTLQKCIETASKINDQTLLSLAYRGLGDICSRKNLLDSALILYKKSLDYSDKAQYQKYRGITISHMGNIYMKKNIPGLALKNFLTALQWAKKQNNYSSLGFIYDALANYYNKLNKNDSALYFAKSGLSTIQNTGGGSDLIRAYSTLATIYKNQNKPDSAFIYLQFATAVKDSLMSLEKIKQVQNIGFDEQLRLQELEKEKIENQNRIRTYTLLAGLGVFLVIGMILYRNNRQKQKANKVLEDTLDHLKSTQSQLIHSEKMASLGELTAGIAHEIKNPLNFVNNFSDLSSELLDEIKEELKKNDKEEILAILEDLKQNLEKINQHGKRADSIVKGMLLHSRGTAGEKTLTDINDLLDQYVNLAYHGMRAQDKEFNIKIKKDYDETLEKINVIPQDLSRVFLNIINNACYAAYDKKKKSSDNNFNPTLKVSTKNLNGKVEIRIGDNGNGIPSDILDKIFQPFFTTKPTGEGTGLGLSLSYDIITKVHCGELKVKTKEGEETEFIIQLPQS